MNARKSVELSRGFLLSLLAGMVWTSLGIAAIQFVAGNYAAGVLFLVAGLVGLLAVAEGSLLRRLKGKRMSTVNLYTALAVFALVGANEIWGLLGVRGTSSIRYLLELVFGVGLVVFLLVTAQQAFSMVRRGRHA